MTSNSGGWVIIKPYTTAANGVLGIEPSWSGSVGACESGSPLPTVAYELLLLLLDQAQPAMAAAYGSLAEQLERLREDAETAAQYILAKAGAAPATEQK